MACFTKICLIYGCWCVIPRYDSSRRKVKQAKDPDGEQVRVLQDALRHMNVAATWKVKGTSPRQSFQWWIAVLSSFSCPWEFAAGFADSISSQVCIPKVWMTFIIFFAFSVSILHKVHACPKEEQWSAAINLGVSKNRGTPKWMVYNGKPLLKWMIWGYPYFWKHPSHVYLLWCHVT